MGLESLVNPQTGLSLAATPGSGQAPASGIETVAQLMAYNGVSWDPVFSNIQGVLVPAGSRMVAPPIATQTNPNHRGVLLFLNVTAAGTGGLTLTVRGVEPVTGAAVLALLTAPTVTATGIYAYALYPGLPNPGAAMGGVTMGQTGVLPRVWTATLAHADASAWTYSLSFSLVL